MHKVIPKWLAPVLTLLAGIGFADAAYLTAEHFAGAIPPCTLHGCETVLTSVYSVILGVPDALLGALFYLVLLVLYVIYFVEKKPTALRLALHLSVIGFITDIWLISAQAFIIHAWCQYCLLSAAASTLIFLLSYWFLFGKKNQNDRIKENSGQEKLFDAGNAGSDSTQK
jgi:uncharacterized membrane protein